MKSKGTLGLLGSAALLMLSELAVSVVAVKSLDIIDSIRSQSLFFETFDSDDWETRWRHFRNTKYNGKFVTQAAKDWNNKGLQIPDKSRYYGLAALLNAPVEPIITSSPEPRPLIIQYEIKYSAGVSCGGAFLKLLTADPSLDLEGLTDATPYSIKFGPDSCGETGKVQVILRHRNPVSGVVSEHHLASPPIPESSELTHIYTLRIFPDNRFEVLVDGLVKSSGSFTVPDALSPPLVPPQQISDPDDIKPADWVEESTIPDPDAVKPADWDDRVHIADESAVAPEGWLVNEPEFINDPAETRPADWNEEVNGAWKARQIPNPKCNVGCGPCTRPLVSNPAYKGEWKTPMISNPAYKGTWAPRLIPNPHFFTDAEPLSIGVGPIGGVAFDLWTEDSGYTFDNVLITRQPEVAEAALRELWRPRRDAEEAAIQAQLKATVASDKVCESAEAPAVQEKTAAVVPAEKKEAAAAVPTEKKEAAAGVPTEKKEAAAVVPAEKKEAAAAAPAKNKEAAVAVDGKLAEAKLAATKQEAGSLAAAAAAPAATPVSEDVRKEPGVPLAAVAAIPVVLVVLPLMVWMIVRLSKRIAAKKKQAKQVKLANGEVQIKATSGVAEAKPAIVEAEAKPAIEEAEAKPAIVEAEAKPAIEEAEAKPAIEEAEAKPAIEEAEAKPAIEEAEAKPAIEEAETKPANGELGEKPTNGEAETKPATEEAETKPATEEAETKPATEEAEAKPAIEEAETKPANGELGEKPTNGVVDLTEVDGQVEVKTANGVKEANGVSDSKLVNGNADSKHENGDSDLKEANGDAEGLKLTKELAKAAKKEAEEEPAPQAVTNAVAA